MIILMMCLAGYLLVGLTMLVALTYLETKFMLFNFSNDAEMIMVSFVWPLSIPILIAFCILLLLGRLVDCLRDYFDKDSK